MLQFEHTIDRDDGGGGFVTITANTTEDVSAMLSHFNWGRKEPTVEVLLAEAAALKAGHLVKVLKSEKSSWYIESGALDAAYIKPYQDAYQKVTGLIFDQPVDLTPFHPKRLNFTHLTDWCFFNGTTIEYRVMVDSQDWDGRTAAVRAPHQALDGVKGDFGVYPPIGPEYLEAGNGLYRRNPAYCSGEYKPPIPGVRAVWFHAAMIQWWRDHLATEGQKAVMDECNKIHVGIAEPDYMVRENQGLIGYRGIRTSWSGNEMPWEEFHRLQ